LTENHDYLSLPVHICVSDQNKKRNIPNCICHIEDKAIKNPKYIEIDTGIYAAEPNLAFLQAARLCTTLRLVRYAMMLCASYRLDSFSPTQMSAREKPLTTARSLQRYIATNSKAKGSANASDAAVFALDGAASPKECELAVKAFCSTRIGSRDCGRPILNYRVEPKNNGKKFAQASFYVVDACFPKAKIAIEYDSNLAHLSPEQKRHDEAKRQTLEADGYKVISVVPAQLSSIAQFNVLADQIRYLRSRRSKNRRANLDQLQVELFQEFKNYEM
jgi:hypothetical protein